MKLAGLPGAAYAGRRMPIIRTDTKYETKAVLVCVNYKDPTHTTSPVAAALVLIDGAYTTMRRAPEWYSLVGVIPPEADGQFAYQVTRRIVPVACYVCHVCGYVEMYSGGITDPGTWSKQGKAD
jgi:hypothetical protein